MTVDINCAFGPGLQSQPAMFGPLYPDLGVDDLTSELRRAGIDRAAIAAPPWLGGEFIDPDYAAGNAAVHDAVERSDGQLFGIGRVNPKFGERGLDVARKCIEEYGFHGLLIDGEVDGFVPVDLAALDPFVSLCRSHNVPLLVVSGIHPSEPMIYTPLARAYADVSIILLRMGAFVPDDAVIAAGLADNIYLETSAQTPREIQRAVAAIGAERVLFGSGFPYADVGVEYRKITTLPGLTDDMRDAILTTNATGLFGLA